MDTSLLLPDSFWPLLLAFSGCFTAPSFGNFCAVVTGWIQCLGRHTVTNVALASGELHRRHVSTFHRFFSTAQWSLDRLGLVVAGLALTFIPGSQLIVLLDDTLARKTGKHISLASMHFDPLLSSARRPFCSFGHVWVVLSLWVPFAFSHGQRGFSLPILFRPFVGSKRGGQQDAPSRPSRSTRTPAMTDPAEHLTKLQLARDMVALLAAWAGERTLELLVVFDSAYAGRAMLEKRPKNVEFISRLRMDAALWTLPPAQQSGQRGRPRRRGERLPHPADWAAAQHEWERLQIQIYGRTVETLVFTKTAMWYVALREQAVKIVIVRDPSGRRKDEAFFCTDVQAEAACILQTYSARWTLEVAFRDVKQELGFEDPQQRLELAVRRTAPMACLVHDLVLLWKAGCYQPGQPATWVERPWYRRKTAPSFADLLTELRLAAWRQRLFDLPCGSRWSKKSLSPWDLAVLATA